VRIHSEVGKGTTVTIFLPRHLTVEDAPVDADTETVLPQAAGGETVLVIDDEALIRMLVVDSLEDLGYRTLEASDGPEGLKVLRSDARIDLLITDVGLPNGMNGRQVADAARALRPGLKVMFVTGYAETAVLSHGHLDPGMQVVTKPFEMNAFAQRIQEFIKSVDVS
jgi:CheY-like chemotaxis protein